MPDVTPEVATTTAPVKPEHAEVFLTELQGADYNPRKISATEMTSLKRSIREFGFVQPVIARKEDGLIIGGHQRLTAMRAIAKEDKVKVATVKIPVVWLSGLTEARTKLLNIALNRIGGEWDYDQLAEVLASITDEGPAAMAMTGFSEREMQDVLDLRAADDRVVDELVDIDEAVATDKLRFSVVFASTADFDIVKAALKAYGGTSKEKWATALVAALGAAHGLIDSLATTPKPAEPA